MMAMQLRIIEGHNKFRVGWVRKQGVTYLGRLHMPASLQTLDQGAGNPGGALAGAVAGGAIFGVAGLIARGRVRNASGQGWATPDATEAGPTALDAKPAPIAR